MLYLALIDYGDLAKDSGHGFRYLIRTSRTYLHIMPYHLDITPNSHHAIYHVYITSDHDLTSASRYTSFI